MSTSIVNPALTDDDYLPVALTEDVFHYAIHDGLGYNAHGHDLAGADVILCFVTPPGDDYLHMLDSYSSEKSAVLKIWENPVITGGAVLRLVAAKNRSDIGIHANVASRYAENLRIDMNSHAADAGEHNIADAVNFPLTSPKAVDLPTLKVLVAEMLTAYAAHHADALLAAGWAFHLAQFVGLTGTLRSAVAPATMLECVIRLKDLRTKYIAHDLAAPAHTVGGLYPSLQTVGGSAVFGKTNVIVGAALLVVGKSYEIVTLGTTDFTLVGAEYNEIGQVFVATGLGAGTGTAAVLQQGYTSALSFAGGTLIYESFEAKGSGGSNATFEHVLKRNTSYAVQLTDPTVSGKPMGLDLVWFELPATTVA